MKRRQGKIEWINGSGWYRSGALPLALEVRRTGNMARKKTVENGICGNLIGRKNWDGNIIVVRERSNIVNQK